MLPKIHCKYDALIDPKTLKPHPKNRNKHPKDQIDRFAKIIGYQGWRYAIKVSNQSDFITTGHGRVLTAIAKKWGVVPVVYQDYESEEQEYADVQADNAIGSWADLDMKEINLDIGDLGPEFDIDWLGIKGLTIDVSEKGLTDPDEVPEPKEARCKLGQLWILGEHRLLCGDSTSNEDVARLMGTDKADMIFTDPPYGVSYEGGHNDKKRAGIKNDRLQGEDLTALFYFALDLAHRYSEEHAAFYIWYANGKAVETFASFAKLDLKVRAVLCWYKVRSGLGAFMSQYIPNYEPCIYAFKPGSSPQWFGPSDEKTVWELPKESKNEFHPTQKPVVLCERAIRNSSSLGQVILDLFLGSGATLIAAEKTNRRCFGMEIDPHYCDVIIERWEKFTGKKAELAIKDKQND